MFKGCSIAVDFSPSWKPKEKQAFISKIKDNGGTFCHSVSKQTTYLLLTDAAGQNASYRSLTAQRHRVPVLLPSFVDECIQSGQLLDHEAFLATGSTKMDAFSTGKIIGSSSNTAGRNKQKDVDINKLEVWPWGDVSAPEFDEHYLVAKGIVLLKDKLELGQQVKYSPLTLLPSPTESHGNRGFRRANKTPQWIVDTVHQTKSKSKPNTEQDKFVSIEIHVSKKDVEYQFRVFSHHGAVPALKNDDGDFGMKECRYTETAHDAISVYAQLYQRYRDAPNSYSPATSMPHPGIGSIKYREYLRDTLCSAATLTPEVTRMVELLWAEAVGEISEQLTLPLEKVTLNQVESAEAVLLDIRNVIRGDYSIDALDEEEPILKDQKLQALSEELYTYLPHRHPILLHSMRQVAQMNDLCQLVRDIRAIRESVAYSTQSLGPAKLFALHCSVDHVPEHDSDFGRVKQLVERYNSEAEGVTVRTVFRVRRATESEIFRGEIGNRQLLLHSSRPQNFVGILSRGLLMPKIVVDDYGGRRSDPGMLGDGLYFSDSALTCAKYSRPSGESGTRFLMVHEVALGNCLSTYTHNPGCQGPPEGHHSLHGVRATVTTTSDFQDDEYVIYTTTQQRMRYLVEFSCTTDKVETPKEEKKKPDSNVVPLGGMTNQLTKNVQKLRISNENNVIQGEVKEELKRNIDLSDVQDVKDPLSSVQLGLVAENQARILLKEVHIRANMVDLVAKVVILQSYANTGQQAVEAKYVFAVDDVAVVSGFEAFINGKHVVGVVKEKEEARAEYKEAIKKGHGAYLMEQEGETPEVSTVSVGNLPAGASVLIKITYITELPVEGDNIIFSLPSSVATWRHNQTSVTQTLTDLDMAQATKPRETSLQVAIEMPFNIQSIKSPTHKIRTKHTDTKALVALEKDETLDKAFTLQVALQSVHNPRMWVERHPDSDDSRACMLAFYPEFDVDAVSSSELVLVLDMSNSMTPSDVDAARKALLLCLSHCPPSWTFNVVTFGTAYFELFPKSQQNTKQNRKLAFNFLQNQHKHCGTTEMYRALRPYFLLLPPEGATRNVFLFSDGDVTDEDTLLLAAYDHRAETRVFTMGIGKSCNKHFLRKLALNGSGSFEYIDPNRKSRWERCAKEQLERAAQPVLTSVSVEWEQFEHETRPVQAPQHINCLFNGSRLVVYGFVPNCTQATLKAQIGNREVSTLVSTSDLSITTGTMLHQLTARSVIQDWEDGILDKDKHVNTIMKKKRKKYIINLSKKYTVVSQFTSFIAVEKRSDESVAGNGPSIEDLIALEDVDHLLYMSWDDREKEAVSPVVDKEQLLKQAREEFDDLVSELDTLSEETWIERTSRVQELRCFIETESLIRGRETDGRERDRSREYPRQPVSSMEERGLYVPISKVLNEKITVGGERKASKNDEDTLLVRPAASGSLFGSAHRTPSLGLFGSAPQAQSSGSVIDSTTQAETTDCIFGTTPQASTPGGPFGSTIQADSTESSVSATPHAQSSGGLFGSTTQAIPNSAPGLFGTGISKHAPSSGSLSGAAPQPPSSGSVIGCPAQAVATGGLFGKSNQAPSSGGLFGSASQAKSTTGGVFGSTFQADSTGSPFGTTPQAHSQGGLFGSTTQAAPTGGLFANSNQPPSSGGLFGSAPQAPSSGGLFGFAPRAQLSGSVIDSTTQAQTTGGIFGTTPQASSSGGLFGGGPQGQTSGSLFGTTSESTTGNPIGPAYQTQSSAGLFGSSTQAVSTGSFFGDSKPQPPSSGGLFGAVPQVQSSGGLFGSTTQAAPTGGFIANSNQPPSSGGLFGSAPQAPSSGGLAPRAQLSGSVIDSTTQAETTGGIFGTPPQASSSGGLFGGGPQGQTSGDLFRTTAPAEATTGNPVGPAYQTQSSAGLFGSSTQAAPTGGLIANSSQPPSSVGLFGSASQAKSTTGNPVGSTSQAPSSVGMFGSSTQAASTGGLFIDSKQVARTGGLFGSTAPTPSAGSIFGSTHQALSTTGVCGANNRAVTEPFSQEDENMPSKKRHLDETDGKTNNEVASQPIIQSTFGGSSQPSCGGLGFSSQPKQPAFDGSSQPAQSAFGSSPQPISGSFGGSSQPSQSAFGSSSQPISGGFSGTSQPAQSAFGSSSQPIFGGFGGSSQSTQSTFDFSSQPAQSTFGGSSQPAQPAFGDSSQPAQSAFGDSSQPAQSAFGDSSQPTQSAFGFSSQPAQSAFGSSSQPAQSAFGGSAQPRQSVFGGSAQPTQSVFGGSPQHIFGGFGFSSQSTQSAFGFSSQPAQSTFGGSSQPAQPAFGDSSQPAQSAFGDSSQPAQSAFGDSSQPTQSAFGFSSQPAQSAFGSSSQPAQMAFGFSSQPAQSAFGGSAQPTQSAFGGSARPTQSVFGGSPQHIFGGFGGSSQPAQPVFGGSSQPIFGGFGGSSQSTQSAFGFSSQSTQSVFGESSLPKQSTFGFSSQPTQSAFGFSSQPTQSVFGGSTQPTQSVFGGSSQPAQPVFGPSSQPIFGGFGGSSQSTQSAFGFSSQPTQSAFGFSSQPTQSVFGSSSQPTQSVFGGSPQPVVGGFGGSSQPAQSAFSFGSQPPLTTSNSGPHSTQPAFGVASHPTPSAFSFGSQPKKPTSSFGSQSTQLTFGVSSQPTQPSFGVSSHPQQSAFDLSYQPEKRLIIDSEAATESKRSPVKSTAKTGGVFALSSTLFDKNSVSKVGNELVRMTCQEYSWLSFEEVRTMFYFCGMEPLDVKPQTNGNMERKSDILMSDKAVQTSQSCPELPVLSTYSAHRPMQQQNEVMNITSKPESVTTQKSDKSEPGAGEGQTFVQSNLGSPETFKMLYDLNPDVYWTLDPKLSAHLGYNVTTCFDNLVDAGLNSLGENTAEGVKRLVATLLVLLHVISKSRASEAQSLPLVEVLCDLFPGASSHAEKPRWIVSRLCTNPMMKFPELPDDGKGESCDEQYRRLAETLANMVTDHKTALGVVDAVQPHFGSTDHRLVRAAAFCSAGLRKYNPVCQMLELGNTWVDFISTFIENLGEGHKNAMEPWCHRNQSDED